MKRFEEQITIGAPADKVFAYVGDFTRHGEWSGHGLQATQVGSGPVVPGTKFSTVAKQFGTQREESTITAVTPPEKFGWDSKGALGRISHWFQLRADGGSTSVTKVVELAEPKFITKMFSFRLARDIPKALRADLTKIKSNIEGSAP